jgi:hypothetical protein
LRLQETDEYGYVGYQCIEKGPDATAHVKCHITIKPGIPKTLEKDIIIEVIVDQVAKIKAIIYTKAGHAFLVFKRQFGYIKVRFHF